MSARSPIQIGSLVVSRKQPALQKLPYSSSTNITTSAADSERYSSTNLQSLTTTTTKQQQQQRSREEIAKLIEKRVQERKSWITGSDRPSRMDIWKFLTTLRNLLLQRPRVPENLDREFPLQQLNWTRLTNPPTNGIQLTWLGHSSLLIQMNGWNILTDPIFSQRCSPIQWLGPQRWQPAPCQVADFRRRHRQEEDDTTNFKIHVVLISHNHYDHLDYTTVRQLAQLFPHCHWMVPLGLREWFQKYISPSLIISELDWHESVTLLSSSDDDKDDETTTLRRDSLNVTSIPMRHWTNRTGNRDKTLWCGFVLRAGAGGGEREKKVLFPGDTAWFNGWKEIGTRYGPFDVAAIPIGAYAPREFMKFGHINVPEAIAMKDAIQAQHAVPIHWGTFPLSAEPVLEPRELLIELMKDRIDQDSFVPWLIGETKQFGI